MITEDLNITEFKWMIDCPEIFIVDKKSGNEILRASGSIYQNSEGKIELKAYISVSDKENLYSSIGKNLSKAGVLIEPQYQIRAVPYSGVEWLADTFTLSNQYGSGGTVIKAQFHKVTKITNIPVKTNSLSILIYGIDDFPAISGRKQVKLSSGRYTEEWTRNEVSLSIKNVTFKMIKDKKILSVSCYPKSEKYNDKITEELKIRILESLRFLLGKAIQILKIEYIHNGYEKEEIYSVKRGSNDRIMPPLQFFNVAINSDNWLLFKKYFEMTLDEQSGKYHKLSQIINSILDSSRASIEGQCLSYSIAVEGIINNFFKRVKVPEGFSNSQIDEVKSEILKMQSLSDNQRDRILNLIGVLNQVRAKDKLYELHKSGHIEKKLINVWDDVRNKSAHGTLSCMNIQKCFDNLNCLIVLFYQLIFLLVGYTGKYTDYSSQGFPEILFEKKLT